MGRGSLQKRAGRRPAHARLSPVLGSLWLIPGLGGCILNVDKAPLGLAIPSAYREATAKPQTALPKLDWWRGFRSRELTGLVEGALAQNYDIAAAVARIRQADALARIAGAPLLPLIDFAGDAERIRPPRAGASGVGIAAGPTERVQYSAALSASYELDFFGRNRATLLAAEQTALATRFARETVVLATLASVSTTYFQILAAQDRLRIARGNVAAATRILDVIRERLAAGTASSLDVAQQEALLATQRAAIPPLEVTLRQNMATLAVLVGFAPEQIDIRGGSLNALAAPRVTPGLPSDLLLQRPDLRDAEYQLDSANADVTAARAAFFPTISLTGNGGFQSARLASLFSAGAWQYNIAANLAQPIFRGGQLVGELNQREGRREELLQIYRQAIIAAFADVERALVDIAQQTRRERLQTEAVAAARRAFEISETRFREGTIDLITMLNTQQTLFQAQDTLAQVRLARLLATVNLFQALGGGWPPLTGATARAP